MKNIPFSSLIGLIFLIVVFLLVVIAMRFDKPRYASDQPLIAGQPDQPVIITNSTEREWKEGEIYRVDANGRLEKVTATNAAIFCERQMRKAFVTGFMIGGLHRGLEREENPDTVYSPARIEWFWGEISKTNINSMTNASLWLFERWMEGPK